MVSMVALWLWLLLTHESMRASTCPCTSVLSDDVQQLEASTMLPKHLQSPHLGCGRLAGWFVVSGVFLCGMTVAGVRLCQDRRRTSAASDKGGGRPRLSFFPAPNPRAPSPPEVRQARAWTLEQVERCDPSKAP